MSIFCEVHVIYPLDYRGRKKLVCEALWHTQSTDPFAPPSLPPTDTFLNWQLSLCHSRGFRAETSMQFLFFLKKLWRTVEWVGLETFSIYDLYILDSKTFDKNRFLCFEIQKVSCNQCQEQSVCFQAELWVMLCLSLCTSMLSVVWKLSFHLIANSDEIL